MNIKMSITLELLDLPKSESDAIIKVITYASGLFNNPQVESVSIPIANMEHKIVARIARFFSDHYYVSNEFHTLVLARQQERSYEPKRIADILNEIRQSKGIQTEQVQEHIS